MRPVCHEFPLISMKTPHQVHGSWWRGRGFANTQMDQAIDYKRELGCDFFGFKTLEKSYLLRVHGKIVERPPHIIMRAACGIHMGDLGGAARHEFMGLISASWGEALARCSWVRVKVLSFCLASRCVSALRYDLMSQIFFTHATPTLFDAGTPQPQVSSCFLLKMQKNSIEGMYDTFEAARFHLQVSRRYRRGHLQRTCQRLLHPRHQWPQQRPRAHAAQLQ